MRVITETKLVTLEVTEREFKFIQWCLDNADDIDIVKKTPLKLSETPKVVKGVNLDEIPF